MHQKTPSTVPEAYIQKSYFSIGYADREASQCRSECFRSHTIVMDTFLVSCSKQSFLSLFLNFLLLAQSSVFKIYLELHEYPYFLHLVSQVLMDLLSPITTRFTALRSYTGSLAWHPLVQFSRSVCLSLLSRVRIGRLEIFDTDGTRYVCGTANFRDGEPQATLSVQKDTFWVRLLLFADMVRAI
jgi:hypothetical protein